MQLSYLIPLLLAISARSFFVLVPLYRYPGNSASTWSNVTAAIAANPQVNWQIIVNPSSGPGTYPPDANYIAGVSKINSYPNAVILGYVDTGFKRVSYSTLKSRIDIWAKWSTYTAANIAIDGIFFDDVSSDANSATYSYYQQAAAYAYSTIPSDTTPVVFNPGTKTPDQLFAYADTIIQYEGKLST